MALDDPVDFFDLTKCETRPRMALTDPLPRALGRDASDIAMLTAEHRVGGKSGDYALLRRDSMPTASPEGKKLGGVSRLAPLNRCSCFTTPMQPAAGTPDSPKETLRDRKGDFKRLVSEEIRTLEVCAAAFIRL